MTSNYNVSPQGLLLHVIVSSVLASNDNLATEAMGEASSNSYFSKDIFSSFEDTAGIRSDYLPQSSKWSSSTNSVSSMRSFALEEHDSSDAGVFDEPAPVPLSSTWTFWFDFQPAKTAVVLNEYMKELKKASSFKTLSSFWASWKDMSSMIDMHNEGRDSTPFSVQLFKSNIKPVWEDAKNINGGKWVLAARSSAINDMAPFLENWESMIVSMILGDFGDDKDICGAVFSVRSWGLSISLWNRDATNRDQIDTVTNKLEERFGHIFSIKYQSHQAKIEKTQMNTRKSRFTKAATTSKKVSKNIPRGRKSSSCDVSSSSDEEISNNFSSNIRAASHTRAIKQSAKAPAGSVLFKENSPKTRPKFIIDKEKLAKFLEQPAVTLTAPKVTVDPVEEMKDEISSTLPQVTVADALATAAVTAVTIASSEKKKKKKKKNSKKNKVVETSEENSASEEQVEVKEEKVEEISAVVPSSSSMFSMMVKKSMPVVAGTLLLATALFSAVTFYSSQNEN